MFIKLLKWIHVMMLGYLFFERALLVLPNFGIADLFLASLSFVFFAGYMLYLICNRLFILVLSVFFYFLYYLVVVWHTYLYPLVTNQEYIVASVFYLILGLPLLIQVFVEVKHKKQRDRTHMSAPLL